MSIGSPVTDLAVFGALVLVASLLASGAKAQQPVPDAPSQQKPKTQTTAPSESSWPRTFANGADIFSIHQPQVDKWEENLVSLYAAGIHITDGARGAELRSPTCTECGATQRIRVQVRLGRIHTPGIMVPRAAVPITTRKQAEAVAGRGYNTNIYTGNTYGYRGGVTYNPNTGIVAGGGAGFVGNIYTGQGAAGRGGFIYNTNTNAGIAAGKDNIYAGKDGTVFRYNRDSGSWSVNNGNGWKPVERPEPKLQNQQQLRNKGAQRTQNFNSMRGFGGGRMRGGGRRR